MNYLIVANGPFLCKEIILEAISIGKTIVALDGAGNRLALLGIKPHVIFRTF